MNPEDEPRLGPSPLRAAYEAFRLAELIQAAAACRWRTLARDMTPAESERNANDMRRTGGTA